MDKMEWAVWSLGYLRDARSAIHDDFNDTMGELRGYQGAHRESWYGSCKNIVSTLYHFSMEFVAETKIPSESYASPDDFERKLEGYRAFVQGMVTELDAEDAKYQKAHKVDGPPFLVSATYRQVHYLLSAVDYAISKKPAAVPATPQGADLQLIAGLARRFHESVLSLATHPHGGTVLEVKDEWDSQYLFRAILAAYVADIRDEEWNPSVAGTSGRCEFFLKTLRAMVELKYVRKATDAAKVKKELAVDLIDYGGNAMVDTVVVLIYDPKQVLKNPVGLIEGLSGATKGPQDVIVVISPPRDG